MAQLKSFKLKSKVTITIYITTQLTVGFKSQTFSLLSPVIGFSLLSPVIDNTFHVNFFVSNAMNSLKVI